MAEAKLQRITIVTLVLNVEEALYLKSITQNPTHKAEGDREAFVREAIFEVIPSSLNW